MKIIIRTYFDGSNSLSKGTVRAIRCDLVKGRHFVLSCTICRLLYSDNKLLKGLYELDYGCHL